MKKTLITIISLIVIAIGITIFINSNEQAKAWYNYVVKVNHFNKGEKIYIENYSKTKLGITCKLWRLIRPLTANDIDSLNISDEAKQTMKMKFNPLSKPYLFETNDKVETTYPDHFAGLFVAHEIMRVRFPNNLIAYDNVNLIYPDQSVLKVDEADKIVPNLPEGYTWANNNYYVPSLGFSSKKN